MNRPIYTCLIPWVTTAFIVAASSLSYSGPVQTRSLEETLLEDARSEQLPSAAPQGVDGNSKGRDSHFAPSRLTRRSFWAEDLGLAGLSEDESPLLSAAERMREAQVMLGQGKCNAATQQTQRQVLENLDLLLEQLGTCRCSSQANADKASQTCKSNAPCNKSSDSKKPSDKPGTSPDGSGKAAKASSPQPGGVSRTMDTDERRAILKQLWGELPAREREQMLQMPVEEFLPSYEHLIEEYFRTLSKKRNKP